MESRRLYIGGISESVLENDIKAKFGEFGRVKSVEIRCKENYGNRRYFAYVDIEADSKSFDRCVHQCNNLEWKGGCLKVQPAKESFLQKTQKEILERKNHSEVSSKMVASSSSDKQQKVGHSKQHSSKEERILPPQEPEISKHKMKEEQMEVDRSSDAYEGQWNSKKRQQEQLQSHGHRNSSDNEGRLLSEKRKAWKDEGGPDESYNNRWNSARHPSSQDVRHKKVWADRQDNNQDQSWSSKRTATEDHEKTSAYKRQSFGGRRGNQRVGDFSDVDAKETFQKADPFESQRNDLFEDIDAADELAKLEDGVPDLDSDVEGSKSQGHVDEENEDDPISETQLKKLFDGKESQAFTLSSLFSDQLIVEKLPSSDEEEEGSRSPRRTRKDSGEEDRFGDEYWRRAEHKGKAHQKSWEEMRRRPTSSSVEQRGKVQQSFFLLPGDQRLNEGLEEFQTDADPSQFIDAWAEQAEQLTLRLFQRKTNFRSQKQMSQRVSRGFQKKASKNTVQTKTLSEAD